MELHEALARHGVSADAADPLSHILHALAREPEPHTTVAAEEAVDVHIADSLAALEINQFGRALQIADVGAGAGFPGLPLAVALPDASVDLIEATRRKADVIGRLIAVAQIPNARVVPMRAEEWAIGEGRDAYDIVCARAVAPLAVLAEYAAPLLGLDGLLVAWKGRRDLAEEDAGAAAADELGLDPVEIRAVEPYPGSRDRHLHLYRKSRPTPDRFPRRAGMAAKRPLA